jgi:hypothetical protein
VLRPGTGTTERYIGTETDLVATYRLDTHTLGYASHNHRYPGIFIRKTGLDRSNDDVYAALQLTF